MIKASIKRCYAMNMSRNKLAYELRESGLKLKEIGERLGGVSATRARDLAKRWERHLANGHDPAWDDAMRSGVPVRVINAYRCAGFETKDQIAKALRDGVKVYNAGRVSTAALRGWLGIAANEPPTKPAGIGVIRAAITVLERAGYTVSEP